MDYLAFILQNQLTAENWGEIAEDMPFVLGNHAKLIRDMANLVLEDKAGRGDKRKAYLGVYYDEVQQKVNWICVTADEVWAGQYGNDEERKKALGADYDVVMAQVNRTAYQHQTIYIPENLKAAKSDGRYFVSGVPTALGKISYRGFDQHAQGSNPYVFDGSGCGFMSFYTAIATIKNNTMSPKYYADEVLTKITGAKRCPISIWAGCKLLNNEGIKHEWVKGPLTNSGIKKDISAHLTKGMPVVISLSIYKRTGGSDKNYTNYAHYAIVIGETKGGKWYLLDSGGHKPRYVDADDIVNHIPATKKNPDYDPVWNGWANAGGYVKIFMSL